MEREDKYTEADRERKQGKIAIEVIGHIVEAKEKGLAGIRCLDYAGEKMGLRRHEVRNLCKFHKINWRT